MSRRWHSCAHEPELIRNVACTASCRARAPARLRSLARWLRAHARHVRSLELAVELEPWEAEDLVRGCLAACRAAGPPAALESVAVRSVTGMMPPFLADLCAAELRSGPLERLEVRQHGLQLRRSMQHLSSVRRMVLAAVGDGALPVLAPQARLPPALEELELQLPPYLLAIGGALPEQASMAVVAPLRSRRCGWLCAGGRRAGVQVQVGSPGSQLDSWHPARRSWLGCPGCTPL